MHMTKLRLAAAALLMALAAMFGPLLGAGVASAAPNPAPAPAPAPQFFQNSSSCGATEAILMPGTTETNPTANPLEARGEMGKLGLQLQQKKPGTNVWLTPYKAEVGPVAGQTRLKESVDGGIATATQQIQSRKKACPYTKFVLGGYSQGALGMSKVCQNIGQGRVAGVSGRDVSSCELIGNPARGTGNRNASGAEAPGAGILGNGLDYGDLKDSVYETCLTGDPYCSFLNQQVAAGLGGGQGSNSPGAQIMSIPKVPWAGSNGLPQTLADSLGSLAPLAFGADNPHVRYSVGPNSPISQVTDRVATGRQAPTAGAGSGGGLQIPGLVPGQTTSTQTGVPFAQPNPAAGQKPAGSGIALPQPSGTGQLQVDGQAVGNTVGTIFGLK